jgi:hypothetical protein
MSVRKKKELLHPIFLECKKQVTNAFWKSLFEEFAYGKYPKQLYITQNQQIQSTNRNQFFQYSFKDKSIDQIIIDIQDLLMLHTNLISEEEIQLKKNEHTKFKEEQWTSWKDIKKKYIKDILLMEFCMSFRALHKFTTEQCIIAYRDLLSYLTYHSDTLDIQLKGNQIDHIDGMVICKETQKINFPESVERQELIHPAPDIVTHYCKRYLLRSAKFLNESV